MLKARYFPHHVPHLSVMAIAALIALTSLDGPQAHAATTIRFSTHVNEQDFRYVIFQRFKKAVEEGTQGRVKIDIFANSTMHPFAKALDALAGGVVDIATVGASAADGRVPCTQATHLMPAYLNQSKIYDLHRAYNQLMKDEFDKLGLEVLFSFDVGYDQEWFFRKPPKKLDQLDGLLVRSAGTMTTHVIEAFGGKPVLIAPAETYQGAERGVVDGLNMGVATVTSWKLWEVMPYMMHSHMFYGNLLYPIPKKKLAELSAPDQQVLRKASDSLMTSAQLEYERWIQQQIGEGVMKNNVTVVSLSKQESLKLVEKANAGWLKKVEAACGPDRTKKLQDLFRKFAG